ncbi:MAG: NB-ARC domain-containing protein, partial [Planctomycetota bacterium]
MPPSDALPPDALVEYVDACVESGDIESGFSACKRTAAALGFADGKQAAILGTKEWATYELDVLKGTADPTQGTKLADRVLNLARLISKHRTDETAETPPRANLAPVLPPNFIDRKDLVNEVVELILEDSHDTIAITGKKTTGVYGMGGIGKTVLATAIAGQPRVIDRFTDGICWITVGDNPNVAELQSRIAAQFGRDANFPDVETGKSELRELLQKKNALLILDDVWKRTHALSLDVMGSDGRILITTRDASILKAIGASQEYPLDLLDDAQAIQLLEQWSGQENLTDVSEANAVIQECGRLPLAVSVCGAMAKQGISWKDLGDALKEADLQFLDGMQVSERGVFQSLEVSVTNLSAGDRNRYLELAVAPSDETLPSCVVEALWQTTGKFSGRNSRLLLARLKEASLLQWTDNGITFHDLQHDFLRAKKRDSLPQLHGTLLDAYRDQCNGDWTQLEDDGYIENHLCYHLGEAGKSDERKQLLLDYRWLQRRADSGIASLTSDFAAANASNDADLKLVEDSIRLSAHVLRDDPRQLPSQLHNRLQRTSDSAIKELLGSIESNVTFPWLRSGTGTLTAPGGPLICSLSGHLGSVRAVAFSPDGRRIVSGSGDNTLKLWDGESGQELASLRAHAGSVRAVAFSPDGRRIVSGSGDNTLKLWDGESGQELA